MWGQPPSAVRRARLLYLSLRVFNLPKYRNSPEPWLAPLASAPQSRWCLPLALRHIHSPPAKPDSLRFQPQTLLDRRVPRQVDLAASSQHPLPWQSKPASQDSSHHSRRSRKPSRPRHPSVSRYLSSRNRPNRALHAQEHRAAGIRFFLGFGHPERSSPARPSEPDSKSKDPYPRSRM